jgi:hypothetical protein
MVVPLFPSGGLELPLILFILDGSRINSTAFPSFVDTYAARLLRSSLLIAQADEFRMNL